MINLEIIKLLIAKLTILITALSGLIGTPQGILKLQDKPLDNILGSITTTSGVNFPTSTPTFNDGDIINAGEINSLYRWVGNRNSTDTDSLAYKLQSSTSSDPGHKHTTASVSGTIAVAQGGTATTTIPTNGQILIGNGTNYSLNTLTAGAGAVITNATGSITIATAGQLFGDGSDGTVIQNTSTTLTRDMFYDVFTVSSSAVVKTGGYRIFAKTSLTINNGTSIVSNGSNGGNAGNGATVGAAGTSTTSGTLAAGTDGKAGGAGGIGNNAGAAGSAGTNTNPSLGVSGAAAGAGGQNGGGINQGGTTGGAGTATSENLGYAIGFPQYATSTATTTLIEVSYADGFTSRSKLSSSAGSGSGGGGGGDTSANGGAGGGSGASGGPIEIVAKTLTNNGTISSNAGNGGNGGDATGINNPGGGGGGGGGSGGVIILAYNSYSGTGTTTVTLGTAGSAGAKIGTGTAGSAGSNGTTGKVYRFIIP